MNTHFLSFCKEGCDKINLQERLTTRDRYSSGIAPEVLVAERFSQHILNRALTRVIGLHRPSIRIVAILAAHLAALHKDNKANTWTINRAKTFR